MDKAKTSRVIQRVVLLVGAFVMAVGLARWASVRSEQQFEARLEKASLEDLQDITKKRDWDPMAFYWLGKRYVEKERYDEAVPTLARSVKLNPQYAPAQAVLSEAIDQRFQTHLQKASLTDLVGIAAGQRDNPVVWYWLGTRLTEAGQHKKAIQALTRSVNLNPKSSQARAALGLVLARNDQPEESELSLRQALSLDPKSAFAQFALGNLYGRYNRWEQAAQALNAAVTANPNNQEAQYLLAICYGRLFQEDKKMEILEMLIQKAPDDIRFLKSLGYVYIFFGKFAQAEQLYRRILTITPNDQETHYLLGRSLAEQANTPEAFGVAEKELKTVASSVTGEPGVYLALGILYFRRNEPARAIPELERAVAMGITETKTLLYLGQAYMRVGRTADGKRTLEKFQKNASFNRAVTQLENRLLNTPDDNEVRLRIVRVYMGNKDYHRALNHLNRLREKDGKNGEVLRLIKECQARLKASGFKPARPHDIQDKPTNLSGL